MKMTQLIALTILTSLLGMSAYANKKHHINSDVQTGPSCKHGQPSCTKSNPPQPECPDSTLGHPYCKTMVLGSMKDTPAICDKLNHVVCEPVIYPRCPNESTKPKCEGTLGKDVAQCRITNSEGYTRAYCEDALNVGRDHTVAKCVQGKIVCTNEQYAPDLK